MLPLKLPVVSSVPSSPCLTMSDRVTANVSFFMQVHATQICTNYTLKNTRNIRYSILQMYFHIFLQFLKTCRETKAKSCRIPPPPVHSNKTPLGSLCSALNDENPFIQQVFSGVCSAKLSPGAMLNFILPIFLFTEAFIDHQDKIQQKHPSCLPKHAS